MLFDRVDFLLKLVVARNDPMEGLYRSSTRVLESPGYNQVVHNILDSTSHIGICCLSEPQESELMWVHYAGNYGGICVEYGAEQLVDGLPEDVHLLRLAYRDLPPRIGIQEVGDVDATARKILSQKKIRGI